MPLMHKCTNTCKDMAEREVYVRGKVKESVKVRFKAACVMQKKPMDEIMEELILEWLKKIESLSFTENKAEGEPKNGQ